MRNDIDDTFKIDSQEIDNVDELFCRCKTIKEQRLSDKQAKSRYINYHSMPFFPYDTKRKEFVFDVDHNLLAEMEKES